MGDCFKFCGLLRKPELYLIWRYFLGYPIATNKKYLFLQKKKPQGVNVETKTSENNAMAVMQAHSMTLITVWGKKRTMRTGCNLPVASVVSCHGALVMSKQRDEASSLSEQSRVC